jgi:hypothetical protein
MNQSGRWYRKGIPKPNRFSAVAKCPQECVVLGRNEVAQDLETHAAMVLEAATFPLSIILIEGRHGGNSARSFLSMSSGLCQSARPLSLLLERVPSRLTGFYRLNSPAWPCFSRACFGILA